jgi:hypothetical protein
VPFAVYQEWSGRRVLVGVHPGERDDEVRSQLERYGAERNERLTPVRVDPATADRLREKTRHGAVLVR